MDLSIDTNYKFEINRNYLRFLGNYSPTRNGLHNGSNNYTNTTAYNGNGPHNYSATNANGLPSATSQYNNNASAVSSLNSAHIQQHSVNNNSLNARLISFIDQCP